MTMVDIESLRRIGLVTRSHRPESSGCAGARELREICEPHAACDERLAHPRAGQNFHLHLRPGGWRRVADVHRGMEVELGGPFAKTVDNRDDVVLVEMTALEEPEQRIGRLEPSFAHQAPGPAG